MSPAPSPLTARRPGGHDLGAALRALDPAETDRHLDVAQDEAARAILRRVVSAPAGQPVPAGGRAAPARPIARRALAVAGAVALVAVGSIAAPRLFGGGEALAWSATPRPLSPATAAEAEAACDEWVRDEWVRDDVSRDDGTDLSGLRPVLTEARGSLVLVYESDSRPSPSAITCYVQDGHVVASGGSAATAASPPAPAVPPTSLHGDLGAVYSTPSGSIRGVTGQVGSDVVGVVLESVAQGPVTATVSDGHFGAWWPDAPTTEARENAASRPEITGATVTLRDGSTRRVTVEELSGRTTEELGRAASGGSASGG
ncbi:hypothetical protein [Humibacillus xanthopallidus]|uniref:Uncharacterized protein n=1 Tax=Humibacillus xanthopallidus TaxID=412689 RepID=A0A543I1K4_9MICO|nr:hypothetical protein [Humibacillus xanthopallidus]TQM64350.1 hypothetical protein FBY41_0716 [Humibacillus xanthopallidus]